MRSSRRPVGVAGPRPGGRFGGPVTYRQSANNRHGYNNGNRNYNNNNNNTNPSSNANNSNNYIDNYDNNRPPPSALHRPIPRGFTSARMAEAHEKLTLDNVTFEQIMALDIDQSCLMELRQPGKAAMYLNQVNDVCRNQIRNAKEIKYEFREHGTGWVCSLTIDHPERKIITCKMKTKKDAKNEAALAAIHHLRQSNTIDSRLKFMITDTSLSSQFSNQTRGPIPVAPIPMKIKQQMMSFSRKFDECMDNLIEFQIDDAQKFYSKLETVESEGKHLTIDEGVDLDEEMLERNDQQAFNVRNNQSLDIFTSRPYTAPQAQKRLDCFRQLRQVYDNRTNKMRTNHFYEMINRQEALPIRNSKQHILNAMNTSRVIVVAGDTGSGKSTQLPQFILEDFLARSSEASFCNVAITQPRRISAISLAERVAAELGEGRTGQTVGHQVRFDVKPPSRDLNAMMFFTTGMLLRKLQRNPDLDGITHLVIDEVHERDCTTDFLLILIKRIMTRRRDLRIILMSASMDADLFSQYFDRCPVIQVSGRCFPVENIYMEDLCREIGVNIKSQGRALRVNRDLMIDTILYIDDKRGPGAILCFLPGWSEIKAIQKELEMMTTKTRNRLRVFTVHSKLPISEQRLIFNKSERGERKVILATNIAETSITIDDVAFVIDSGLCNSIDYDPNLNISNFGTRWISRANAKQRSGRAGRTCSGESFKLYTRADEMEFREFPYPELLRIPLESVIMEVKCHCPNERAVEFLSQAIQHPTVSAINSALEELISLRVLDTQENLTVLGKRISSFTTHPRLSVSLVLATALRCLYPVLNVSAMLSSTQEPFRTALAERQDLRHIKMKFCNEAMSGDRSIYTSNQMSDHLALATLLKNYDGATQSRSELEYFIDENILSRNAMANITECRNLYAKLLVGAKFANTFEWYSTDSQANVSMDDFNIFTGALIQAFYPKIIRIIRGAVKNNMVFPNKVQALDTKTNQRIRMATDSVLKQVATGKDVANRNVAVGYDRDDSDDDSDYLSQFGPDDRKPHFVTYLNSRMDQESNFIVVRDGTIVQPNSLIIFGGTNLSISEARPTNPNDPMHGNPVILTLDCNPLLSFRLDLHDAQALRNWRSIWQRYFDWFVHTKNSSRASSVNDEIINKTLQEFLDITRQLLSSS